MSSDAPQIKGRHYASGDAGPGGTTTRPARWTCQACGVREFGGWTSGNKPTPKLPAGWKRGRGDLPVCGPCAGVPAPDSPPGGVAFARDAQQLGEALLQQPDAWRRHTVEALQDDLAAYLRTGTMRSPRFSDDHVSEVARRVAAVGVGTILGESSSDLAAALGVTARQIGLDRVTFAEWGEAGGFAQIAQPPGGPAAGTRIGEGLALASDPPG